MKGLTGTATAYRMTGCRLTLLYPTLQYIYCQEEYVHTYIHTDGCLLSMLHNLHDSLGCLKCKVLDTD
jgi:hypothetical protein